MAGREKHAIRSRRSSRTYSSQKSQAMQKMEINNDRKQSLFRRFMSRNKEG